MKLFRAWGYSNFGFWSQRRDREIVPTGGIWEDRLGLRCYCLVSLRLLQDP